jgi:hypothetical protein
MSEAGAAVVAGAGATDAGFWQPAKASVTIKIQARFMARLWKNRGGFSMFMTP